MKKRFLIVSILFSLSASAMRVADLSPETRSLLLCLSDFDEQIHLEEIQGLIRNGADVNAQFGRKGGSTPLSCALSTDNSEVCRLLIRHGARIDYKDTRGNTLLHKAAEDGQLEICRLLIEHGAVINVKNIRGATPLHLAAGKGQPEIHQLLQITNNKRPRRSLEVCTLLIQSGAHVHARTNKPRRWTPLCFAAEHGNVTICRLLLENGAQLIPTPNRIHCGNSRIKSASPLSLAARNGHLKLCRFFLESALIPPEHNEEEAQKIRKDIVAQLCAFRRLRPLLPKEIQLMIIQRAFNEELVKIVLPLGSRTLPPCIPFLAHCLTSSTIAALKLLMTESRTVAKTREIEVLLDPETLEGQFRERKYNAIMARLRALLIKNRKKKDED